MSGPVSRVNLSGDFGGQGTEGRPTSLDLNFPVGTRDNRERSEDSDKSRTGDRPDLCCVSLRPPAGRRGGGGGRKG